MLSRDKSGKSPGHVAKSGDGPNVSQNKHVAEASRYHTMDKGVDEQVSGNGVRADDGDAIGRHQGLGVICRASGSRRLEDAAA